MSIDDFRDLLPERERDILPPGKMVFQPYSEELGNFTVVVLSGSGLWAGVAKCNPDDSKSRLTGLKIAAARAMRSYKNGDPKYGRQRPTTKRQAVRASVRASMGKFLDSTLMKDYNCGG